MSIHANKHAHRAPFKMHPSAQTKVFHIFLIDEKCNKSCIVMIGICVYFILFLCPSASVSVRLLLSVCLSVYLSVSLSLSLSLMMTCTLLLISSLARTSY